MTPTLKQRTRPQVQSDKLPQALVSKHKEGLRIVKRPPSGKTWSLENTEANLVAISFNSRSCSHHLYHSMLFRNQ